MEWLVDPQAWIALATLTALEIVLGVDNIIFISILVGRLPEHQRDRARVIGLGLAMGTRIVLLLSLAWIMTLTAPLFTLAGHDTSGRDLILIGGGIVLGELLDESGLARTLAGMVDWQSLPPAITLVSFVTASALLSSVASNTAAATLLIQLGLTVSSTPSFTILIAIAASFGTTFAISTPPNALAYGQGGLRVRDLFIPGVILMVIGIVLVSVTGPLVLGLFGIR